MSAYGRCPLAEVRLHSLNLVRQFLDFSLLFADCGKTHSLSLARIMAVYQVPEGLTGHFVVQNTLFGREGLEGLDLSMEIYWNRKA